MQCSNNHHLINLLGEWSAHIADCDGISFDDPIRRG
jgi:hypothetical protein